MDTKFLEAGQGPAGLNWGKFLICRYDDRELDERATFPGCEDYPRPLVSLRSPGRRAFWVLDLQTGEGVRFDDGLMKPWDIPTVLNEHRVWVCVLFEPTMVWLAQFIDSNPNWWDELPRHIELPETPGGLQGYRRSGERFQCPLCGMKSSHPDDIREGYCGHCRAFTASRVSA